MASPHRDNLFVVGCKLLFFIVNLSVSSTSQEVFYICMCQCPRLLFKCLWFPHIECPQIQHEYRCLKCLLYLLWQLFLVRVSRHPVLSQNYFFHQFVKQIGWREAVSQTGYAAKSETLFQYITHTLSKLKPDQ